eukprot:symbB.v1.2.033900.t1/scaffold4280.1/size43395/3
MGPWLLGRRDFRAWFAFRNSIAQQGCSPGSLNLATLSMESPQAESSAKRRRLTHRDMHVAAWTEGSSSGKKEGECEDVEDDSVKVKKEKVAQQIHSIDKDVQWLKVKKEIKEETEQDMKSSNFDDDIPLKEVEVKDEMENDEEDHDKWPQTSEVAVKQEVRRRLTRKVQVAPWTETSSSEKNGDGRAKIKMETVAEHEVSFASPLADADGHEDPAGAARSLDDFASQAAAWAKQCLAFRRSSGALRHTVSAFPNSIVHLNLLSILN